jgi:hypothetical protein
MAVMVIQAVKQWNNVSISAEDLARMERFADNDQIRGDRGNVKQSPKSVRLGFQLHAFLILIEATPVLPIGRPPGR